MTSASPPIREASTVVLVREADAAPFEIFMVRRHAQSGFMGGAFVFPGGVLDADDVRLSQVAGDLDGEDAAVQRLRAIPEHPLSGAQALALHATACRELFEEAGVLLARKRETREWITETDDCWLKLVTARTAQASEPEVGLGALAGQYGIELALSELTYWAHWVTPSQEKKRFDARFFIARLPGGQRASCDGRETTEHRWMSPAVALAEQVAGEIFLPPPTLRTLEELLEYESIEAMLDAAGNRDVYPILPKIAADGDVLSILLPWDSDYPAADGEELAGMVGQDHPMATDVSRIVLENGRWFSRTRHDEGV